jgi:hypothetical protein
MGHADNLINRGPIFARIESNAGLEMLVGEIGPISPEPHPAAPSPALREARVELESTVDQCEGGRNILTEVTERIGRIGEDSWIIPGRLESSLSEPHAVAACLRLVDPAAEGGATSGKTLSARARPVIRITVECLLQ